MNFVKRRWPDLLIVLLVLLLLLGFASLLLGKSPASLTGISTSQPATTEPTSSAPSPATGSNTQGTSSAPTSSQSSTATTTPTTTTPPTTSTTSAAPSGQPTTAAPSNGTNSTPATAGDQSQNAGDQTSGSAAVPTIPAGPIGTDTSTNNTPPAATPTTPAPTPSTTPPPATTTTPTLTPRAGGSVSTSETRVPTRNDYRISLGTFSSTAAVQAATADVSRLGYTVYPITVASGAVAQVGPFATREQANQALADIQRAMPSALLYPPRNAPASDSGSSSSSSASSSTASTSQSSASAQSTPAAAPDGPVYLQVGAYNTVDAAQATVSKMRDLGYDPTVNAPAGRKVTVLVGPFRGDALLRTERRLDANGQDHFRVR